MFRFDLDYRVEEVRIDLEAFKEAEIGGVDGKEGQVGLVRVQSIRQALRKGYSLAR